MRRPYHDRATGWRFEADAVGTPPVGGGIVLTDVTHQQFSFARDIRVIGIWLEVQTVTPAGSVTATQHAFHALDSSSFTLGNVVELTPMPMTHPPVGSSTFNYLRGAAQSLQFEMFFRSPSGHVGYGLSAEYTSRPAMFSGYPNCEVDGLTIEQIILCSRYASSPPHEPSGALLAARLLPMLRFAFTPNAAVDRTVTYHRVESIRVDYRIHLKIDRHHNVSESRNMDDLGNRAGFFKDRESLPAAVLGGIAHRGVSGAAFEAIEKPLVLEAAGPGLAKGFNFYSTGPSPPGRSLPTVVCWDNVHQWGRRPGNDQMISAPGAFHAAHLHWRWGGAVVASTAQFKPSSRPTAVENALHYLGMSHWPPLVDPRIWIQSIRIAVTKADRRLDPAHVPASSLSTKSFIDLFQHVRSTPADIFNGDDLVTWISFQVHRELNLPSVPMDLFQRTPPQTHYSQAEGVLFHHGIFFAHEPEQSGPTVGPRTGDHRPRSIADIRRLGAWFRPAS